ncbi:MAG: glutamine--fructose-6-phosphate transaminase (isomerizing) [Pseudomonadota bacterium]
MCGIIGISSHSNDAAPRLLESLSRLEYRGYDSAGIATHSGGKILRRRAAGKLSNLRAAIAEDPISGSSGIGHTRWATHGPPTLTNAHPHQSGPVALVHNGIIENFRELRTRLESAGHAFETETDTETIAHLIASHLAKGASPQDAVQESLSELRGAFALAIVFEDEPDLMIGARLGSPLVIGIGEDEMFLGSDALAVAPFTQKVVYLEEGDWCVLRPDRFEVFATNGARVDRPIQTVQGAAAAAEKGNYRHFMQKEIYEQPDTTARTIGAYVNPLRQAVTLPEGHGQSIEWDKIQSVHMIGCGTAYYATAVAEYWFEQLAGLPVKTDIASEFRYRQPALPGENGIAIFVSQSGETADTLAALRYCKNVGLKTAAVVNVQSSSIAREVDLVLPTLAGPEIGVASTKAFTAQLCALAACAIAAGVARGRIDREQEKELTHALTALPRLLSQTVMLEEPIISLAREYARARDVIYLGRGVHFPIALEGALKLKEISYIHAEGYASGELKHGPIALVDEKTPIIFIAPDDMLFEKSLSNLEEVVARGGKVTLISDAEGIKKAGQSPAHTIEIPECHPLTAPILYALPVQLIAYHTAVEKGTDVDQPRNLAKSVTVE